MLEVAAEISSLEFISKNNIKTDEQYVMKMGPAFF